MLPREIFFDVRLDSVLGQDTVSMLRSNCENKDRLLRAELFYMLESPETFERFKKCLSVLKDEAKAIVLVDESNLALENYCLRTRTYKLYVAAVKSLISLGDCGRLLSDVAEYFLSNEKQAILSDIESDLERLENIFQKIKTGLISLSDKIWVTPDCDSIGEYDRIAGLAENLGFSVNKKRSLKTKMDSAFDSALSSLYSSELAELKEIFNKYDAVDLSEPLVYIPEMSFFVEIMNLVKKAERQGIPHCYPVISEKVKYYAKDVYDISLLSKNCEHIIPNDVDFSQAESVFFLTGANSGGKTTYLRAVGANLLLYLAGCPIFAKRAEIYPFEFVASHFPKDERFDRTGRLGEELKRVKEMLDIAKNKKSFLIFNEMFSGADERRGYELLMSAANEIKEEKHIALFVTHFHNVLDEEFPVLSAQVHPLDENKRTYKIIKQKGRASSYAADILKKYGIDKESLSNRRNADGN